MKLFLAGQGTSEYGITGRKRINDEPVPEFHRALSPRRSMAVYWTCGCGRRHRIPNVERADFACPACEDKYNG